MTTIKERLEELRREIQAERISYGEIAELQSLAEHIEPGDVELLQWAGVPEFPEEGYTFVNDGIVDGVQYVTVVDSGNNPAEYGIPLAEALQRYGRCSMVANPGELGLTHIPAYTDEDES